MRTTQDRSIEALYNKSGAWCAFWVVVQQLIVALSSVAIIQLIENLVLNKTLSLLYSGLFIGSLIFVYLPTAMSHIYLRRFQIDAFEKYISKFIEKNDGRRTLSHKKYKNDNESWITSESYLVFNDAGNLIYEVFATFLNSLVSILVIGLMLDPMLLAGYGAAFVILCFSNYFFKHVIETASFKVQNSRKKIGNSLLSVWDNVFIGNSYNLNNWKKKFYILVGSLKKESTAYVAKRFLISSLTVLLSIVIIGMFVAQFVQKNWDNTAALSALVVTFPRQIQIIQSVFAFFGQVLEWQGMKAKLLGLDKPMNITNLDQLKRFCDFKEIEFNDGSNLLKYSEIVDFIDDLKKIKNGRITIRGKNGSGKSTMLSHLAEALGRDAFYLPTKSDLIFKSDVMKSSDGQKMLQVVDEISSVDLPKYLILDEWDANLDLENIKTLDQKIAKISQNNVIIEVRHRG